MYVTLKAILVQVGIGCKSCNDQKNWSYKNNLFDKPEKISNIQAPSILIAMSIKWNQAMWRSLVNLQLMETEALIQFQMVVMFVRSLCALDEVDIAIKIVAQLGINGSCW